LTSGASAGMESAEIVIGMYANTTYFSPVFSVPKVGSTRRFSIFGGSRGQMNMKVCGPNLCGAKAMFYSESE
jgi:hypothetical protein